MMGGLVARVRWKLVRMMWFDDGDDAGTKYVKAQTRGGPSTTTSLRGKCNNYATTVSTDGSQKSRLEKML